MLRVVVTPVLLDNVNDRDDTRMGEGGGEGRQII